MTAKAGGAQNRAVDARGGVGAALALIFLCEACRRKPPSFVVFVVHSIQYAAVSATQVLGLPRPIHRNSPSVKETPS